MAQEVNMEHRTVKKGNSHILGADSTKYPLPAQVIVRPFNLPKLKESIVTSIQAPQQKVREQVVATIQVNRPKERFLYQHNVKGDVDTRLTRDVIIPHNLRSESPPILRALLRSKDETERPSQKGNVKTCSSQSTKEGVIWTEPRDSSKTSDSSQGSGGNQKVIQIQKLKSFNGSMKTIKKLEPVPAEILNKTMQVNKPGFGTVQQVKPMFLHNGNLVPLLPPSVKMVTGNALQGSEHPLQIGSVVKVRDSPPSQNDQVEIVSSTVINGQKLFICKSLAESPPLPTVSPTEETTSVNTSETSRHVNMTNVIAEKEKSENSCNSGVQIPKTVHLEILEDQGHVGKHQCHCGSDQLSKEKLSESKRINSDAKVNLLTQENVQKLLLLNGGKPLDKSVKLVGLKQLEGTAKKSQIVLQPIGKIKDFALNFSKPIEPSPQQQPQIIAELHQANASLQKSQMSSPQQSAVSENSMVALKQGTSTPNAKHVTLHKKSIIMDRNPQVILQQRIDHNVFQRRKEIALQYQRDVENEKKTKKVARTLTLPQRTVCVVEASTQTSLFSVVEPGRFVELSFSERSNTGPNVRSASNEMEGAPQRADSENAPFSLHPTSTASIQGDMGSEQSRRSVQNESADPRECVKYSDCQPEAAKRRRIDKAAVGKGLESEFCPTNTPHNINRIVGNVNNVLSSHSPSQMDSQMDTEPSPWPLGTSSNKNSNITTNNVNELVKNKLNNEAQLKQVYEDWKRCVICDDESGNIPLHDAVIDGDLQMVRRQCLLLTARGESIDWANKDDETPLHLAVSCGHEKITELLLCFKADPSERDCEGNSAFHLAVGQSSNIECLKALLKRVGNSANQLDSFNDEGYSPLHLCVLNNKEKEAMLLMEKGAFVNIRDAKSGKSPLFHAVLAKNNSLSRLLVRYGCSTTTPNYAGQTPLSVCEMSIFPDYDDDKDLQDSLISEPWSQINSNCGTTSEGADVDMTPCYEALGPIVNR